ncbi:MAG: aldo/keto reductase [Thaumarchaeota archaeon]|nr:MAG: aldo/keto reductase [Nitrososphaerota archaeon]
MKFAERSVKGESALGSHFRTFESLSLGSLGIGTYLGDPDAYTDQLVEEAVFASLKSGVINVVDTAINYRSQRGERSVGRALQRLAQEGVVKREEVFLASKNGYVTNDGELPMDIWTYIHREFVKPGILKPDEIGAEMHSTSVPFLKAQFERSLRNLGVGALDLMYLHNAGEAWLREIGIRRFLERLEAVFSYYEEERRRGRLKYYGLATWNSFRVPNSHPEHLNLDDAVDVARNVGGGDHGFRFIQLPLNLGMTEAFTRNQRMMDDQLSVLEAAERLGVGIFTSAPLDHGRLLSADYQKEGYTRSGFLLQFPRSTHPSVIAPLVGHKQPEHVTENLKIGSVPPLSASEFSRTYGSFLEGGRGSAGGRS